MNIGKLGVWGSTEGLSAKDAAAFAKRVEARGYGALWIPEAVGRNVLVHASWLLANTTSLVIATGIANIYARDAAAMASAQLALAEQSGGRFLLGLGVSEPLPSWGALLRELENYSAVLQNPWMLAPAVLLVIVVSCLQLLLRTEESAPC